MRPVSWTCTCGSPLVTPGFSPTCPTHKHLVKLMDGKPVYDVPPDWIGAQYPSPIDEQAKPEVEWWAKHPDGRYTPVFVGAKKRSVWDNRPMRRPSTTLEDDVKKLLGLPPHDHPANICWNDGYFAKALDRQYGEAEVSKVRERLLKEAGRS